MAISTPSTTSLCSLHTSSVNTTDHHPDGRPNQPPISSPATTGFSPQVSPQKTLHSSANGIKTRIPVPHFSIPSTPSPTPQFITSPGRPPAPRFSSASGHSPTPQFSTTPGQTPAQFSSPSSLSPSPEFSTPPCLSPAPQFSTPPRPPMFSLPLQPAAVPFRTPPASPQAVSYSSTSSSLSASSLPLYLNGSVGLQSQTSDGIDKSMLDGASPFVLFSTHKVLKQKKFVNISSLGFGALVSPGREIAEGPQIVQRHPHRCENCGAFSNLYCSIILTSGKWQCVICKNLSGSEGDYAAASREDLRNWPELSLPMVDYIQTVNGRPGFIPVSNSRMSAPVFLVIDECLDELQLKHLQSSLHAFVDSLPPNTRIGIISYGRTVSVYDFSQGSVASADVLPGDRSPTRESLKALIFGTGIYLAPIHASLTVAHAIFSSMRAIKLYLPEPSRDRCIGTAVEVALAIIQGLAEEMSRGMIRRLGGNCRILVCAGGPNTYGPGSVPHSCVHPNYPYMEKMALNYMGHLGHEAHQNNTVIDILCAGTCPVRVPILQPLAKASGGVLILHDDFGEVFGINLQRASMRSAGSQGLFEIRCSDDIIVTRVIGPGEEAASDAHETFKNDASTCIQMLSVEETQSFTLSMEATSDIKNDHVFFQFAFRYSNVSHADISRVITIRLPAVDSISSYLKSIQDEVAAVLIAKRTVLQAKTSSDVVEMRLNIDERMKDIATRFGYQPPMLSFYQLPREICSLPENLFHLRRGPLLGSIVGHEDERLVLRNLFLNASFDLSLRMVAPRCLMHRDGGTFEELPAHDLAMQSDVAVVLDHGTDVFIWLGAELATEEGRSAAALEACRTLVEELTEQRFPAPRILAFKEGSSQARYFVSRLIPAHKDPPYEQEARFPQLQSLTAERRARLKSSLIHSDDFSFCEWMQSLKLIPPRPA